MFVDGVSLGNCFYLSEPFQKISDSATPLYILYVLFFFCFELWFLRAYKFHKIAKIDSTK